MKKNSRQTSACQKDGRRCSCGKVAKDLIKCGKAGCRYNQRNPHKKNGSDKVEFIRDDFSAKCKACGWEGNA